RLSHEAARKTTPDPKVQIRHHAAEEGRPSPHRLRRPPGWSEIRHGSRRQGRGFRRSAPPRLGARKIPGLQGLRAMFGRTQASGVPDHLQLEAIAAARRRTIRKCSPLKRWDGLERRKKQLLLWLDTCRTRLTFTACLDLRVVPTAGEQNRPMPLLLLGLRTRSSAWNASNCPLVSSPHLTPDLPHQLPKLVSYFFIKCLHGMLVLKHIAYPAASSEIVHGCVISVRRTKQAPTVLGDLCHEAIAAEASRKRHRAQSWATAAVSVGVLTC
ncbi:unnamed protein product, partial [Symbiodinium necroappetens]